MSDAQVFLFFFAELEEALQKARVQMMKYAINKYVCVSLKYEKKIKIKKEMC